MYGELIQLALNRPVQTQDAAAKPASVGRVQVTKVNDRGLSYNHRSRGQWYRPEYDFDEIQIAQATDSYISRSISKKVNRVIVAGWSFTSNNDAALEYVKKRIRYNEFASRRPFDEQLVATFYDLFRFNNCMWIKARRGGIPDAKRRTTFGGLQLDPVAGYFIAPMPTLFLKSKRNGELVAVQQSMPDGTKKVFPRHDVIHFYTNRSPGLSVGTPELLPALDDVAVLRRLEENIEELVESNLFPVYHWKVGSDQFPERYSQTGVKETDEVKQKLEYLAAGSMYVSDHRHEITAIGSEGRALRIETYIQHFKQRVFAALGVSGIDLGEGNSANRSTASTMSKGMLMDVEAMTKVVKRIVEAEVVTEILIEGGFDPFDEDQMVHLKFGVIDKEERRADENQQIQLWHGNLRTMDEVRAALGDRPFVESDMDRSFQKMFAEPLELIKHLGPGTAAGESLAKNPASSLEKSDINSERQFAEEQAKEAARAKAASGGTAGRPATSKTARSSSQSANKARPANQTGSRASAKTVRDLKGFLVDYQLADDIGCVVSLETNVSDEALAGWLDDVLVAWRAFGNKNISLQTVADTMAWRLESK